jgi:hypothetical protein
MLCFNQGGHNKSLDASSRKELRKSEIAEVRNLDSRRRVNSIVGRYFS